MLYQRTQSVMTTKTIDILQDIYESNNMTCVSVYKHSVGRITVAVHTNKT